MLKKRLVGVISVLDGWAVQSFGFGRYLPLGKPECLVENLGRWGADEILVLAIDRSKSGAGPDLQLLEKLSRVGTGTPLIYGGGIRDLRDGIEVIQRGADRICVDALLSDDLSAVRDLSQKLGAQAVIASMPLSASTAGLEWLDYRTMSRKPLGTLLEATIESSAISEVLLIDWMHEGTPGAFDAKLIERFPYRSVPLIVFGGISEPNQVRSLVARPSVTAVAMGNFLSYREHAIQQIKSQLKSAELRPATFATEHSIVAHV